MYIYSQQVSDLAGGDCVPPRLPLHFLLWGGRLRPPPRSPHLNFMTDYALSPQTPHNTTTGIGSQINFFVEFDDNGGW